MSPLKHILYLKYPLKKYDKSSKIEELNQREERLQKGEAIFQSLEDIKKEFKSFK